MVRLLVWMLWMMDTFSQSDSSCNHRHTSTFIKVVSYKLKAIISPAVKFTWFQIQVKILIFKCHTGVCAYFLLRLKCVHAKKFTPQGCGYWCWCWWCWWCWWLLPLSVVISNKHNSTLCVRAKHLPMSQSGQFWAPPLTSSHHTPTPHSALSRYSAALLMAIKNWFFLKQTRFVCPIFPLPHFSNHFQPELAISCLQKC